MSDLKRESGSRFRRPGAECGEWRWPKYVLVLYSSTSKVCAACIDLPKDAGLLDLLVICVGHEQLVPISASSLALCTPFSWSIYVSVQGYCTAGTMGTMRSVRPARLILFTSSLALSVRRFSSKYVSAKDAATVDLWILRVNPDLLAPLSPPAPHLSWRCLSELCEA